MVDILSTRDAYVNKGLLGNANEPKPVVPEVPPDLRAILRSHVAKFALKSSSLMLFAARKTKNRHVVIRPPLEAFNIKNFRAFTRAEIVDVNAAAQLQLLRTRDDMPTITGSWKTVWPSLCAAMHVWSETLVMDRASILHIERTSWRQHEEFYKQSLIGIYLRLRWARETWARGIFRRLCDQFCVDLASALLVCMTRNYPIVYIGFTLQVKRAYYGMVHERAPHERWQEHWRVTGGL